jgi:thioredoxin-related protein
MNPEKDHTFNFGDTSMSNSELYLWLGYGQRNGFPTTYFWLSPNKSEERYCLAGYHEPAAFITILNQVKAKKQH